MIAWGWGMVTGEAEGGILKGVIDMSTYPDGHYGLHEYVCIKTYIVHFKYVRQLYSNKAVKTV